MKKFSMLALAFALTLNGFSQNKTEAESQSPEAKKNAEIAKRQNDDRTQEILKALNLTDDQKVKLKEINKINKEAKSKVSADTTLSDDEKKIRLKEIRKDKSKRFMDLLTPEQLKLYKEMKNADKDKEKE